MSRNQQECVGTLLVPVKDLQELTGAPGVVSELQKCFTSTEEIPTKDEEAEETTTSRATGSLAGRITERLQGPAPPVGETEELDA